MKRLYILLIIFFTSLFFAQDVPKIGLVLSGGGAKGYAHVGVLEVIDSIGLKIDYIGGTSMGAIVGGFYASGYSAKEIKRIINDINFDKVIFEDLARESKPFYQRENEEKYLLSLKIDGFKFSLPKSISKGQASYNLLTKYLNSSHELTDFSKLPIPFLCIATDIETGEQKVFKNGFLPKVVLASGAYPTLFSPIEIDGSFYTDGGIVNNFPIKEVKEMGADIVIGVDLGEGLMSYDKITNVAKVLEQIITYGIEEKSSEQRKLTDILIKPEVKGLSVTDFKMKSEIIEKGYLEALKYYPILDSLSKLQTTKNKLKRVTSTIAPFIINEVNVSGLKNYSLAYVLGKLKLKLPQATNLELISEGINNLHGTENFSDIEYKLVENESVGKTLNINLKERSNDLYARFGLHYNELFKSSLLLNLTFKNPVSINSSLSLDLIAGDNPRYNLNYFVDNGIRPSFGLSSYYQSFFMENPIFLDKRESLRFNYRIKNWTNKAYIQSTLLEKYAIGIGLKHRYLKIFTNNVSIDNPNHTLQNSYFYSAFSFLKADTRDDGNFPKRGFLLNSRLSYLIASNLNDFESSLYLNTHLSYSFPITKRLSITPNFSFGYFTRNKVPNGLNFFIGGQNRVDILNTHSFYGLPFGFASGSHLLSLGLSTQYEFINNHFILLHMNLANIDNSYDRIRLNKYEYQGYGIGYGYKSPFGPLNATLSYSPNRDGFTTYISLGHWF